MGFSAPVAWFLQESPAFLVPFGLWLYRGPSIFDKATGSLNTNLVVLSYFLIHYFNRLVSMLLEADENLFLKFNGLVLSLFQFVHLHSENQEQQKGQLYGKWTRLHILLGQWRANRPLPHLYPRKRSVNLELLAG